MPRPGPDQIYSFAALYRAYRRCRRTRRNTFNALAFEIDAEAKLLELRRELIEHTYRPGRSICFITDGPKPREVFAADFRDRIVHHLLVAEQERIFEPRFIHDSYACRKGKGTLAASDRLVFFLRRITANGRRPAWALKLDIASFFPSIDKPALDAILSRQIRNPELSWLTRVLLFHDPTSSYEFRSTGRRNPPPSSPDYPIPARKSLFGRDNQRGLPIGNLTSQFWANVYLNELDQFVKRQLRCPYYLRYVDDLVLLSEQPGELVEWRERIREFLGQALKLDLRADRTEPFPAGSGVDFVGWVTWWSHRVVGNQTLANLRRRLAVFERRSVRRAFAGRAVRLELVAPTVVHRKKPAVAAVARGIDGLASVLASYSGHLRHGAAWRDWMRRRNLHPWLDALFEIDGSGARLRWRSVLRGNTDVGPSYRRLARCAGEKWLVFFRVGSYIEFYGPQRFLAQRVLGLRLAAIRRFGYAFLVGFPAWLAVRFAKRSLDAEMAIAIVKQVGGGSRQLTLLVPSGSRSLAPFTSASGACIVGSPP
jgi:hypothetical protein